MWLTVLSCLLWISFMIYLRQFYLVHVWFIRIKSFISYISLPLPIFHSPFHPSPYSAYIIYCFSCFSCFLAAFLFAFSHFTPLNLNVLSFRVSWRIPTIPSQFPRNILYSHCFFMLTDGPVRSSTRESPLGIFEPYASSLQFPKPLTTFTPHAPPTRVNGEGRAPITSCMLRLLSWTELSPPLFLGTNAFSRCV